MRYECFQSGSMTIMNSRLITCFDKAGLASKFAGASPTQTFADLGVDSLDLYALILEIQEEFNIEVADEELSDIVTVGDLNKFVK